MPVTIYAHLTWTTKERAPLITMEVKRFLERFLPDAARSHAADVMELGVVDDHVHVLLPLPPVIDIPRLVQSLKGASARIANRDVLPRETPLRWASGYDLRSVSPQAVLRVEEYIRRQASHHPGSAIRGTQLQQR